LDKRQKKQREQKSAFAGHEKRKGRVGEETKIKIEKG
jgi:hypothetical protein